MTIRISTAAKAGWRGVDFRAEPVFRHGVDDHGESLGLCAGSKQLMTKSSMGKVKAMTRPFTTPGMISGKNDAAKLVKTVVAKVYAAS